MTFSNSSSETTSAATAASSASGGSASSRVARPVPPHRLIRAGGAVSSKSSRLVGPVSRGSRVLRGRERGGAGGGVGADSRRRPPRAGRAVGFPWPGARQGVGREPDMLSSWGWNAARRPTGGRAGTNRCAGGPPGQLLDFDIHPLAALAAASRSRHIAVALSIIVEHFGHRIQGHGQALEQAAGQAGRNQAGLRARQRADVAGFPPARLRGPRPAALPGAGVRGVRQTLRDPARPDGAAYRGSLPWHRQAPRPRGGRRHWLSSLFRNGDRVVVHRCHLIDCTLAGAPASTCHAFHRSGRDAKHYTRSKGLCPPMREAGNVKRET